MSVFFNFQYRAEIRILKRVLNRYQVGFSLKPADNKYNGQYAIASWLPYVFDPIIRDRDHRSVNLMRIPESRNFFFFWTVAHRIRGPSWLTTKLSSQIGRPEIRLCKILFEGSEIHARIRKADERAHTYKCICKQIFVWYVHTWKNFYTIVFSHKRLTQTFLSVDPHRIIHKKTI